MSYDGLRAGTLNYAPCRYGASNLLFRGPERRLDAPFVAFLGGTETYGKYIKAPFPALVESTLGVNCINFGICNAGIDVFLNDPGLTDILQQAHLTVVQVVGAGNLSNKYYSVHPRRNDRFVAATPLLTQLYPEVDFAEFHFNKHMLSKLHNVSWKRFATVRTELQEVWMTRMALLLKSLPPKTVLFWFADHVAHRTVPVGINPADAGDPLFVTQEMLAGLDRVVQATVTVKASDAAIDAGVEGMVFNELEALAAGCMLGAKAHGEAAANLSAVLQSLIRLPD